MKTVLSKQFSFFLILSCIVLSVNGQMNLSAPLDHFSLPKSIKKHKVKSLVIFMEMNKRDISRQGSVTGKLEEVSFNAQGLMSYRLRSDNRGNPPFIAYGKGCYFEIKEFSEKKNLLHLYMEDFREVRQELMTYDTKSHLTNVKYLQGIDTAVSLGFTWLKGEMIKSELLYGNESNKDWVREYDNNGRIKKTVSGNRRTEFTYESSKDSLWTTQKTFRADTLYTLEKYTTWVKYDRVTFWEKKGANDALISHLKVGYDKYGNATSYYLYEPNNRYRGTVNMTIKNFYDKRKLLVKRLYYSVKSPKAERELTKIERFVFDTVPLVYQFEKGGMNDDIDYKEIQRELN